MERVHRIDAAPVECLADGRILVRSAFGVTALTRLPRMRRGLALLLCWHLWCRGAIRHYLDSVLLGERLIKAVHRGTTLPSLPHNATKGVVPHLRQPGWIGAHGMSQSLQKEMPSCLLVRFVDFSRLAEQHQNFTSAARAASISAFACASRSASSLMRVASSRAVERMAQQYFRSTMTTARSG